MLAVHFMRCGDIPFAVAVLNLQCIFLVRFVHNEVGQFCTAAGHICVIGREQQVAAGRTAVKPHFLHIAVSHIVFLQIASQQGFGVHAEGL